MAPTTSAHEGQLVALDATGQVRWSTSLGKPDGRLRTGAPAIGRGGEIYVGCEGCDPSTPTLSGIARLDRLDGRPVWVAGKPMANPTFGSVAIDASGNLGLLAYGQGSATLIVAGLDGTLASADPVPETVSTSTLETPVAGEAGFDFLESEDSTARISGAEGIAVPAGVLDEASSFFFAGPERIGVSTGRASVESQTGGAAILGRSGEIIWRYLGDPLEESLAPLVGDGILWVVSSHGRLQAMRTPSGNPEAGAAWPLPGHDGSNARTLEP